MRLEGWISSTVLLALGSACSPSDTSQVDVDGGLAPPAPAQSADAAVVNPGGPGADASVAQADAGRQVDLDQEPDAGADGGVNGDVGRAVDLLFVVDNSISMSDKQELLGRAVPDVLGRLTQPPCVDADGNQFPPPLPGAGCPAGQRRQFEPVENVHVGVISTSLGDGGANVACPALGFPTFVPDRIDMAHLIGSLPRGSGLGNEASGFLSWRVGEDQDSANQIFQDMLNAVGDVGCGWEMSLEAWYRFLIDPAPYASLARVACPGGGAGLNCVQPATNGAGEVLLDEALLDQREAFLRPSSQLAIVMLTDENDCSLAIGGQSWVVLAIDDSRPFFRGSSACDADPNAACCYSCPLGPPSGCAEDPICAADPENDVLENRLPREADGANLRCFRQQQRFGVDFLYPTERYVNALTRPTLCLSSASLAVDGCTSPVVPNPLFAAGREPSDVFLTGIIGVPWQLLEAQQDVPGRPSVESGFRYKLAAELAAADWAAMLGDPGASPPLPPSSPFMVESALPRAGVVDANPINGREYDTATGSTVPDDLEYACIFPMPAPRDCSSLDPALEACDCFAGNQDRPLCEETPGVSAAGPLQHWAKAYPGTRQLEVLQALGNQSVVASICARNVSDLTARDFAYRPAIAALMDSMEPSLRAAP
jgi:hypothetical protein